MFVSTSRVAQELGLSRRRVSELVRTGDLEATSVGGRWLIDAGTVAQFRVQRRVNGRPWDSDLAWEMLKALSGLGGELSSRAELRLLNTDAEMFAAQIQRLIEVQCFQARKLDLNDFHVFLTGESALSQIDNSVLGAVRQTHLYTDVSDIAQYFDAARYLQGNLVVYRWRDGKNRVVTQTPSALIAVDAARSPDSRIRYAGIDYLRQELETWQEIHSQ